MSLLEHIHPCGRCVSHAEFQELLPEISLETLREVAKKAAEKGGDIGTCGWIQTPFTGAERPLKDSLPQQFRAARNLQIHGHEKQADDAGLGTGDFLPSDVPLAPFKLGEPLDPTGCHQDFEDRLHPSDPTAPALAAQGY